MDTGDIVLIPFPFAELTHVKARPCVVIAETGDRYKDIIVAAISSVVPPTVNKNEFLVESSAGNGLRVQSIVKVDRLVTQKPANIIAELGSLNSTEIDKLISIFRALPSKPE